MWVAEKSYNFHSVETMQFNFDEKSTTLKLPKSEFLKGLFTFGALCKSFCIR